MKKKKAQRIVTLEQWLEVETHSGTTVTVRYPSNADLHKKGLAMDPPPDLVYRRINFRSSVPVEYHWTTLNPERRRQGGHCIQRMTLRVWHEVCEHEALQPGEHAGPCGGILPRPEARGGCDCPQCVAAQRRLDAALL